MKIFSIDKLLSLGFGVIVFAFFAFLYPFHLNYQEQYQLFLFSPEYFFHFMAKPGGLSDYIGNFFTQFFFYSWVGAIIIATGLTLLQRAVWFISRQFGANSLFVPISFIPSILYWGLFCDENYLFGGLVVLLLVVAFITVYTLLKSLRLRIAFILVAIPVLYWLAGGAFLLLPIMALTKELLTGEIRKSHLSLFAVGSILISVIIPYLSKRCFLQYPLREVWIGANFFRFPLIVPVTVAVVALLIAIIPIVLHVLSLRFKTNKAAIFLALQLLFIVLGGSVFISRAADMKKEEVMAYDFNVRMRKWDRVIALANKKTPSSPLSVTCLNLALAKEDLLGEKMFSYYQNGVGGLLPDFTRDYTIPLIAGEVYYHLGFVNTAQRYAFEAMEALPDYQKSVRCVMRLAETNLINGDYAVSTKYLSLLQKTFYYRGWANNALKTMKDENLIAKHPEWGWLRKCRTKEDFLFSEGEKDMMLGVLFRQNPQNRMAYEYLMAYTLLGKDMKHFLQYFPFGESLNYHTIPKSYQEALYYAWANTNNDPTKDIPYPVSNITKQRFQAFKKTPGQMNSGSVKNEFSDTYWYYLYFVK